jgi:hypothetical protein
MMARNAAPARAIARARALLVFLGVLALAAAPRCLAQGPDPEKSEGRIDPEKSEGRIDPEEMPPVAPMIPTGCTPPLKFLQEDPRFSVFRLAVEETGLDSVFGNVRLRATVFVPDNEAIKRTFVGREDAKKGQESSSGLLDPEFLFTDIEALERLVRMHVVPMYNIMYDDLATYRACYDTMVDGSCLDVTVNGDGEARLGPGGKVGVYGDMRDMNEGCPTTIHAIDGLILE